MEVIDRKFKIEATKRKDGIIVDERSSVLFLAKDSCLVPTLNFYMNECERQGVAPEQLEGVSLLIERVEAWRKANPLECSPPAIEFGEEYDRVCAPNERL